MPTITGVCRHQISFLSLDSQIAYDNEIRFIDAFVGELDLTNFLSQ